MRRLLSRTSTVSRCPVAAALPTVAALALLSLCYGCSDPFVAGTGGAGGSSSTTGSGASGGTTTTSTGDGAGNTGTSTSEGGSGPVVCADPHMIDDFSSAPLSEEWGTFGQGVAADGGELTITPPAAVGDNGAHRGPYDFRGCRLRFEVISVHDVGEQAQTSVALWQDGQTYVQFRLGANHILGLHAHEGGSTLVQESVPYDALSQRWWGFHVLGDQITFETSPDGENWTAHASGTAPAIVASHDITYALNVYATTGTPPGRAAFDNIELLPAEVEP